MESFPIFLADWYVVWARSRRSNESKSWTSNALLLNHLGISILPLTLSFTEENIYLPFEIRFSTSFSECRNGFFYLLFKYKDASRYNPDHFFFLLCFFIPFFTFTFNDQVSHFFYSFLFVIIRQVMYKGEYCFRWTMGRMRLKDWDCFGSRGWLKGEVRACNVKGPLEWFGCLVSEGLRGGFTDTSFNVIISMMKSVFDEVNWINLCMQLKKIGQSVECLTMITGES